VTRSPPADPTAFILAQTAIATPPLTPEIKLHLATEMTPIWEASEAVLAEMNLPPPYWAFAWAGGQALTRFLMDHPDWVEGKSVLDFASGSGLSAIGAAKAGAAKVQAAEIDDFALAAIALNARINHVAVDLLREDVLGVEPRWDIVLAGDVCYERQMAERVIAWLRALAGRGVAILMGDPGRAYLPQSGLLELARYQVPTSLELEDRTMRETIVWRLMP
jgi:predicted nicotinamide N-methyase